MKFQNVFSLISLLLILMFTSLATAQNAIVDTTFNDTTLVDRINTTSIDYMSNPGFLQLETGENENLAKNRFAYVVYNRGVVPSDTSRRIGAKVVDGSYSTFVEFPQTSIGGSVDSYIMVDLQALRNIKRVKIFGVGNNPNTRVRAYTVYTGEDTVTMEKVYQILDNTSPNPEANFDPISGRYVKVVINVVALNFSTAISEIEVFGEGFLPLGYFYSSVRMISKPVNFGTIEFLAGKPLGTEIGFYCRSGNNSQIDSTWSDWSPEITASGSLFDVFEPRKYIQYRVRLATSNLFTPVVEEIRINYDTINVAGSTNGFITPKFAQILKEGEYTLTVETNFASGDYGIDTLVVNTPSPITLLSVLVNNTNSGYLASLSADKVKIIFNSTIKSDSKIDIKFITTPFLAVNTYSSYISSKQVANNPQRVDVVKRDGVADWSIVTVGVPDRLIINANASPNPFTPNGDGKNDETAIQFFLGNIGEPSSLLPKTVSRLSIKVYDLTGRLIRDLLEKDTKAAAFISDNAVKWDGRDNGGSIVRPGVYIYQIFIDSDSGGEYVTKTVVVSY